MDNLQWTLDVDLKKKTRYSPKFFSNHPERCEASYPLLISFFAWLRRINATLNKTDVMNQNEQMKRDLKCIHKQNFLLFLMITKQFKILNRLWKSPLLKFHLSRVNACKAYRIRRNKKRRIRNRMRRRYDFALSKQYTLYFRRENQSKIRDCNLFSSTPLNEIPKMHHRKLPRLQKTGSNTKIYPKRQYVAEPLMIRRLTFFSAGKTSRQIMELDQKQRLTI